MIESRNGFISLPTAFAMCPMAINASTNVVRVRVGIVGRQIRHTERTLVRFAEKSKEVAHRFVEKVFAKGLRVVYGKGRNKGNDHFPHQRIPGGPKAQDTLRCVHEVFAHELRQLRIGTNHIQQMGSPCHHEVAALYM
jgi:hypothetical protein